MVAWRNSYVTNKKCYISFSTRRMATRLDRVMVYDKGPSCTKLNDSLIKWSYEITWQIENVISLIPQFLWTLILEEWWLMTWDYHSKNCITLSKNCSFHSFFFLYSVNVPLILYRCTIQRCIQNLVKYLR